MIKMLATILQQCGAPLIARDIVMSDLFEMYKSEKMLSSFKWFYEND